MSRFPLDRREFVLTGAAACLGIPALTAQSPDDGVKARLTRRLDAPDGAGEIDSIAFSADRRLVAAYQSGPLIRVWDTKTGNWRGTLRGGPYDSPDLFAVVDDGKTALAWDRLEPGVCLAWDLKTGDMRTVFQQTGGGVSPLEPAASLDGKRVAALHDGSEKKVSLVRAWDVGTGKPLWEFDNADGKQEVGQVAFSPDGKTLAVATRERTVKLLETTKGKEVAALGDGKFFVDRLEWLADGKHLAAVLKLNKDQLRRVVVWNTATGKTVGAVGPFTTSPHLCSFSPDGKHLAIVHGSTITIWEVPSEKPVVSLWVPRRLPGGLVWSVDGKSILFCREVPNTVIVELLTFDLADLLPKT